MSKEIITIGDSTMVDKTLYCPMCGVQIDYYGFPPNYCPKCGGEIDVRIDSN